MANYIVSDTNLGAVADAIREKGGTSAELEFPTGFVSAIGDIQTGGGDSQLDALIDGSITSVNSNATSIKGYAFKDCSYLTGATFPNATSISDYAFSNCKTLASINAPSVMQYGTRAFEMCYHLRSINNNVASSIGTSCFVYNNRLASVSFDNISTVPDYCFQSCYFLNNASFNRATTIKNGGFSRTSIGVLTLPAVTTFGDSSNVINSSTITTLDLSARCTIKANALGYAYSFIALILRDTSGICTLANTNALSGTPIAQGKGFIYVPANLVDTYKAASNWSTYANQIVSLDTYPKSLSDAGLNETVSDTWDEIIESSNNGTYNTKYSLGDTKFIKGENGVYYYMQLVAKDVDVLSDNSGNAHMTWLCTSIPISMRMESETNSNTSWDTCLIREYLRTVVLSNLPSKIRDSIKEVKKSYNNSTINDMVWIPSRWEVFGTAGEEGGGTYVEFFDSNTSRIKVAGLTTNTPQTWWLRSRFGSGMYYTVTTTGSNSNTNTATEAGVVFGFCI